MFIATEYYWIVGEFMRDVEDNVEQQKNELEKNIEEIKERQDNLYNPGNYIGSGRIAKPISKLSSYPSLLLVFGIVSLLISVLTFISLKYSIENLPGFVLGLLFSLCFIYGGIVRILKKLK